MSKPAEYYGSTKYMPEDLLRSKLAKAQQDVQELLAEQDRRANFTPEMRLCDRLHHLMHFAIDCDYHYSDWPEAKGCRGDYITLTHQLIHTLSIEGVNDKMKLDALLALMERVRFGTVVGA